MKTVLKALVVGCILASTPALAAPITIGFSGKLDAYTDAATGSTSHAGTSITGSFTFDLGQRPSNAYDYGYTAGNVVNVDGGCGRYEEGVCVWPADPVSPLITQFTVSGAFGTFVLEPDLSGDGSAASISKSSSFNWFLQQNVQAATYRLTNNTGWQTRNGATETFTTHNMGAMIDVRGMTGLFNDPANLEEIINIGNATSARFDFADVLDTMTTVCGDYSCSYDYAYSGYALSANITEMHLEGAAADVPEPASALLFLAGALGMAARRRRKLVA